MSKDANGRMKSFSEILKVVKRLNPMLEIELSDATSWNKTCRDELLKAYADFEQSEERLKKAKARYKEVRL